MMNKDLKTALIFENLFSWGGACVVNKSLMEMLPNADIYALFGSQQFVNEKLMERKVKFSFLNKFPFIKKFYTHYLPFWPVAIESFDLSEYDLVISSSHWVAKGCISSQNALHISYVHTPMRFLWDLRHEYSKYSLLKSPLLNYLRMWDVSSSNRADRLIVVSDFVSDRCQRYWGREPDRVIHPPVQLYDGDLVSYSKRDNYFVSGAPFAENKGGEFLIECARELGFELKIIGKSRGYKKLKRLAKNARNIEFLGRVSDRKKWQVMKGSKGFLATGIEDFGIFPVEAISCGTPVLALKRGGYLDTVTESVNGVFYSKNKINFFKEGMKNLTKRDWDAKRVRESVQEFNEDRFKREVEEFVRKSI
jgi:glycosyltransferase involved in cell wall biosynthesis